LKGVLSAVDAAAALARGLGRVRDIEALELPLGDGGEGTAEALARALGGEWRSVDVVDALGRPVSARFVRLPGPGAIVESAEAIGLWRLARGELDPLRASSVGLGALLVAALDSGATDVLVTLGGSATVDGGAGLREAIRGRSLDGIRLRAACDVTNPLLGPEGAARVFGPQKGATPAQVAELESRLEAMSELAPYADLPGAGAAGGLGAALASLGAELIPGIEIVLDAVSFDRQLDGVSLAITGEGAVDGTSAAGKVPDGVARACARAGVPCVIFGGRVRGGVAALYEAGATAVFSLSGRRDRARADLERFGEALGRLAAAFSA
jgi:glycerate kinase